MDYFEKYKHLAILGLTLCVTTYDDDSFVGEVYYYNPNTSIIILKVKVAGSDKCDYVYLNCDAIREYKIVGFRELNEDDLVLPPIDYEEILRRERATYEHLRAKEDAKKLENIAPNGQTLFNELKKLYEISINGEDLILKEFQIKIKPPYRPEDVDGEEKGRDRFKDIINKILLKAKKSSS